MKNMAEDRRNPKTITNERMSDFLYEFALLYFMRYVCECMYVCLCEPPSATNKFTRHSINTENVHRVAEEIICNTSNCVSVHMWCFPHFVGKQEREREIVWIDVDDSNHQWIREWEHGIHNMHGILCHYGSTLHPMEWILSLVRLEKLVIDVDNSIRNFAASGREFIWLCLIFEFEARFYSPRRASPHTQNVRS